MDLSLSKLPWYGQIGAFVAGLRRRGLRLLELLRVGCQGGNAQRQTRLTALRADIAKGVATARRLPEFQAQVAELERRLDGLGPCCRRRRTSPTSCGGCRGSRRSRT